MNSNANSALAPTRVRSTLNVCTKSGRWCKEEDKRLMNIMASKKRPSTSKIAELFPGKTGQQILERWDKVLNPELVRGSWTRQEDEIIIKFVNEHGTKNWRKLCELLPGRIGKQCRERWRNHLDPSINHSPWTAEEDELLIKYHEQYGNKWVLIANLFKNRSDNSIKNRWNATLKKRVNDTPKPAIESDDTLLSPQSPASTPIVSSLIQSPFLSSFMPLGFVSPKSTENQPKMSLADNWAKLKELIPSNDKRTEQPPM